MFTLKDVLIILSVLDLGCLNMWKSGAAATYNLPSDEVNAFNQIMNNMTLGEIDWKFYPYNCTLEMRSQTLGGRILADPPEHNISCKCNSENNTDCHIITIIIKRSNLPGILPPELFKLPFLETIDLAYNYLNGTIPVEWASSRLEFISLLANRLSGQIPKQLGNYTSIKTLELEANQFSGTVPVELGKLFNLQRLVLSSNWLSGNMPMEFAELKNLVDFRINDNNFTGTIPDFIQNWKKLTRMEMHASGLEGPIPLSISSLENLAQLRISDINGKNQAFPPLQRITNLTKLVLRNCNISGEIPPYIWRLKSLEMLDLSFNKLTGEIPTDISANPVFIFLAGNLLRGNVPESILKNGSNVDLSYNNFTWKSAEQPACQGGSKDLNLNLFRSSSVERNLSRGVPCMKDFKCQRYWHSLHINCGGEDVEIGEVKYKGDAAVDHGAATFYFNSKSDWGLSSTGDFMDDNDKQNKYYTANLSSNASTLPSSDAALYTSARLSPLSLTYYGYCLENGNYNVSLHFAEIQFTNDKTYSSLGRRVFDIYIQVIDCIETDICWERL